MKQLFTITVFMIASLLSINAQTIYEVYDPVRDTLTVREAKNSESALSLKIPNNSEVVAIGIGRDTTKSVIVSIGNREYSIAAQYLYYSEKNVQGAVDFTEGMKLCPSGSDAEGDLGFNAWRGRDAIEQLLYSSTIQLIVLITVILLQLLIVLYRRVASSNSSTKRLYLILMPLLLLIAVGLEATYLIYMGSEVAWWIDMDRLGFWSALVLCICTGAVFASQIISFFAYKKIIAGGKTLVVKPIFWGVALLVPCGALMAIGSAIAVAYDLYPEEYEQIVTIVVMVLLFALFVLFGTLKNMSQVGFLKGLLFSLFTFIASIGTVAILAILLYSGLQILITIIVTTVPFLLLFGLLMGGGRSASGGGSGGNSSDDVIMVERKDASGNTTYVDWVSSKKSTY